MSPPSCTEYMCTEAYSGLARESHGSEGLLRMKSLAPWVGRGHRP